MKERARARGEETECAGRERECCVHKVSCWAHSPAVLDKPECMKELCWWSGCIITSGVEDEERGRTLRRKIMGAWEVVQVRRKAYQLLWVLSGFQNSSSESVSFSVATTEREHGWKVGGERWLL